MKKITKIKIMPHWRTEIKCLRFWLAGFKAAGGEPPDDDVLRQIQIALSEVKVLP